MLYCLLLFAFSVSVRQTYGCGMSGGSIINYGCRVLWTHLWVCLLCFGYVVRPSLALRACLYGLRFWSLCGACPLPPVALAPLSGAFLGVYVVTGLAGLCESLFSFFGRFLWLTS